MGWTNRQLDEMLEARRHKMIATIVFERPTAGGMSADEKGLRNFVKFQLGIDENTPAFEEALARLKKEELDTTPEGGEIDEKKIYAVNVIRSSDKGKFLLEHMVKAVLKQALSRTGTFTSARGSKGDIAEMGTIVAVGDSLQVPERPWEIYLRKDGRPAATEFREISGSVSGPSGRVSIMHTTEMCEEGAEASFSVSWWPAKLKVNDMALAFAAARIIGLGSCLSLGYGRFAIKSLDVVEAAVAATEKPKKEKKEKKEEPKVALPVSE